MIEIIKAKEFFKQYVSNYDVKNGRINLKIIHTYHVAENSKIIAKNMGLNQEEQNLAELIGLLHDIGRFEQVRLYNSFNDRETVDHASKGLEVLYADKLIRKYIEDDKYDSIIYKSIQNHNKLRIEKGLTNKELLYTQIIRDADNIDIFRGLLEQKIEDFGKFGTKDISKEILTPYFYESFKEERLLEYDKAKNDMDIIVAIIAHIYTLNFSESLKLIKDNDYINKLVKRLNCQDKYTKEKLNEIAIISMEYINKKLKEMKVIK